MQYASVDSHYSSGVFRLLATEFVGVKSCAQRVHFFSFRAQADVLHKILTAMLEQATSDYGARKPECEQHFLAVPPLSLMHAYHIPLAWMRG